MSSDSIRGLRAANSARLLVLCLQSEEGPAGPSIGSSPEFTEALRRTGRTQSECFCVRTIDYPIRLSSSPPRGQPPLKGEVSQCAHWGGEVFPSGTAPVEKLVSRIVSANRFTRLPPSAIFGMDLTGFLVVADLTGCASAAAARAANACVLSVAPPLPGKAFASPGYGTV